MTSIQATPTTYRGTRFRSTLEADWAATFDQLGWYWEYEPVAVQLPDGTNYRPDFYLPTQTVWCEVKGPHNERIHKPVELQKAVSDDEWKWASGLVVILRPPGPGEKTQWEGPLETQHIVTVLCPDCEHYSFMDFNGPWECRHHRRVSREPNKFWNQPGGGIYWPGELPFTRASAGR